MGRRLRTMWRLRDAERAPGVVVAPVRALVQRLGPHVEDVEPVVDPARASSATATSWSRDLVGAGYRREEQVEHRGEVAVRGLDRRRVPVDRRPAGAHRPVGRRGRPPHRVLGRRPALHRRPRRGVEIFPCRELLPTDEVRDAGRAARRPRAVGPRAVGAPGRGPGVRRHGVVAAVAHRGRARAARPRRRRRPGAAASSRAACATGPPTSLAEEADLAATLAKTWGAVDDRRPSTTSRACTSPFDRLLAHTDARRRGPVTAAPEGPDVATGAAARRGTRSSATAPASCRQLRDAAADGLPHRRRRPTARARPARLRDAARRPTGVSARGRTSRRSSGAAILPGVKLAVLAEPDLTGRRRAHRARPPPPPRRRGLLRRPQAGRLRRAPPARRRPLRRHGQARHRRRRARLPAARVQGRRQALRPVRPDRRRAPLHRRRGADASAGSAATAGRRTKARVRAAVREIAQELVVLYQKRLHEPRPRLPAPTRRGSASWRTPSRTRRRPTSSRPSPT